MSSFCFFRMCFVTLKIYDEHLYQPGTVIILAPRCFHSMNSKGAMGATPEFHGVPW